MAHDLEIINGEAQMFSVRETPWHSLGRVVASAPTAAEAIRLAGLDWKVIENNLYHSIQDYPDAKIQITSHKALIRSTDNKVLGIVGKDYTPLQNEKAFEFFNPFIESGLASFETAGSLRDGKTVWVLAKLNKTPIEIGKGDIVNKYLLLSNGHDGLMAVRTGFTPIRVVCNNTLAMSHENANSKLLRIFHSRNVNVRLEAVQQIINAADAKFEATAEQYRALSRSDVDQKALAKYVEVVFGFSTVDEQRRQIAKEKITENITKLFETGVGQDLKGAKGTYWGLYNAVTEMLSWEKGRTEDSRLNSLWFGQSKQTNQNALSMALKMAAG